VLFNSSAYLAFLVAAITIHWSLPARFRATFLLMASYVFYASWSAPYLLLIIGLTAANWQFGLAQGRRIDRSRTVLVTILAINLAALVTFKYLGLLDQSARTAASILALDLPWPLVQIVLPIGLSFFTFEFIHYQVDVFRGGRPITDPVRFALFPAFFPTQIAGPIKRYQDFDRQMRSKRPVEPILALSGLELVALGLFKKIVLADSLLPVADAVFGDPRAAGMLDAWAGLVAFSFQIYLDFSGYTDIARGSAQLLGFTIPENFRSPYLATSLRDFWRRWHISLSSWLRDYLYIPLGGSRESRPRTNLNLLVTMALGGLWHGAAWHFLAWGLGHGIALALERTWNETCATMWGRTPAPVRWVATQLSVLGLWSLFRAPDLSVAATLWSHALSVAPTTGSASPAVFIVAVGILVVEVLPARFRPRALIYAAAPPALGGPFYIVGLGALAAYWVTVNGTTHRFIYFQF
jgi:alginate O-acetyltransferase complex protein AlgI